MNRQVVFGTGQVGRQVITQLADRGVEVVAVNRSGRLAVDGVRVVAGDATDPAFTAEVCGGADAVYFCLNASRYDQWAAEFPPLQHGVLTGAARAGARLVVLDNLYAYGPPHGRQLIESTPPRPSSQKSATRAAMTEQLLTAQQAGQVEVVIGRASDYFGPGTTQSALGQAVFGPALTGATAQVMGDPDQPHSYSFTPDVAAALITLADAPGVTGEVWHLPVTEPWSTRQVIAEAYRLAGHRPRILAAGRIALRLIGLAQPAMREYLHTLYQFSEPWIVSDQKFRTRFEPATTPLTSALAATLDWYRDRNAVSVH